MPPVPGGVPSRRAERGRTKAMRRLAASLVLAMLVMPFACSALAGDSFRLLQFDGHAVKWSGSAAGLGARVGYAFVDRSAHFDDARNCRDMTSLDDVLAASGIGWSELRREAEAAFAQWSSAADIAFHEVPAARADILIGAFEGRGAAFADVAWRPSAVGGTARIERALVCLNAGRRWKLAFDGDLKVYDIRYTLTHEIGHAIGLDHPGAFGALMSFPYEERFRTLRDGDIRGAIALYGARGLPVAAAPAAAGPLPAAEIGGLPVSAARHPFH
ncbi:MAG: matrixin family metalloprotease [Alphaproteobacteria bacterium]